MASQFDTIIVGAGSAGCVLAYRLSEDPRHRVLLLEAGPGNWHPLVDMPRGWVKLTHHPQRAWSFPVAAEDGRPEGERWVRGRGLGGSSAINGMVFCRGAPQDYDGWRDFGVSGWDWADMAPAFQAIEGRDGAPGLVDVTTRPLAAPLGEAVLDAGRAMGLPVLPRMDGGSEGVGVYAHSVGRSGIRSSAARAFLSPARGRRNLTILSRARATRVLFNEHRASAVEFTRPDGTLDTATGREIIVCCGAIQSPHLLQLSGIGPGDVLRSAGISAVADVRGVGRNLAEHLVIALPHRLKSVEGHNRRLTGLRLAGEVIRYLITRQGPLAYGASEMGAFMRSRPDIAYPDLQLSLSPYTFARGLLQGKLQLEAEPGLTIIGYALRPESRGAVEAVAPDVGTMPRIQPNWLSTEADRHTAVAMMRSMRNFLAQPSLAPFVGHEIWPGRDVTGFDDLLEGFRRNFVSGLHAVGSCRMGTDENAVVDGRLRVRGIEGFRVVDASVIPAPVSSNTNGPVMAMAWRAADLIIADRRAPGR